MSNVLSIYEMFSEGGFKSNIELIGSIIGVIGSVFTAVIILIKHLNKPIKYKPSYLNEAGVPNWLMRLFAITIPLKKIPKNTLIDKIFAGLIIVIFFAGFAFFSHMHIQTLRIQEGWTLLTLKATQESFFITHDSAKDSSLFSRNPWSINNKQCRDNDPTLLEQRIDISPELVTFICRSFINKEYQTHISGYISNVKKEKRILYPVFTIIELTMLWLSLSIIFTLIFKSKLRNYIIFQQKKASNYIT
ncbi:DUF6216 family protein [Serratia quinivorans]|uniref:DUF6216 family protein n=1 Tax=Serratia quinivorans TaxID=137545 RepID=UPI002178807B|nr:DUF6216 family protein [Serratia quinivorans]CAI1175523.1 Uncharacterised protein [Serratia quinivorans]